MTLQRLVGREPVPSCGQQASLRTNSIGTGPGLLADKKKS